NPEIMALMAYNDGISPISSTLWLEPAPVPAQNGMGVALLNQLKSSHDLPRARLFQGLDHLDWMDGTARVRVDGNRLTDLLHPNEPPRSVFEWLVSDLMHDKLTP